MSFPPYPPMLLLYSLSCYAYNVILYTEQILMIVILDQGRFHIDIVYTIIFDVQQCLLAVSRTEGQAKRAGYVLSMRLINTTNSWLIINGGFPEGQCKGHADLTSAFLVQPWIAFSCQAALAIHRLRVYAKRLHGQQLIKQRQKHQPIVEMTKKVQQQRLEGYV